MAGHGNNVGGPRSPPLAYRPTKVLEEGVPLLAGHGDNVVGPRSPPLAYQPTKVLGRIPGMQSHSPTSLAWNRANLGESSKFHVLTSCKSSKSCKYCTFSSSNQRRSFASITR